MKPLYELITLLPWMLALLSLTSTPSLKGEVGSSNHLDNLSQLPHDQKKSCVPTDFKIVLDVGHTPEAPGALSARGVSEYHFNLELAKRIEKKLGEAGYAHTRLIMMRGIGKAQLTQRAALANSFGADVFLSVHHDDVQPSYYEEWVHNGRKYHFSDKFSGYSLFVSYQNQFSRKSLDFAKLLGTELISRGMKFSTHHSENIPGERRQILDQERGVYRFDQLIVLKATKAPAVLLEAGVIVNRQEESVLTSSDRQNLISASVLEAVNQFCSEKK